MVELPWCMYFLVQDSAWSGREYALDLRTLDWKSSCCCVLRWQDACSESPCRSQCGSLRSGTILPLLLCFPLLSRTVAQLVNAISLLVSIYDLKGHPK